MTMIEAHFASVQEAVEYATKQDVPMKRHCVPSRAKWIGRKIDGPEGLREAMRKPWPRGQRIFRELRRDLPEISPPRRNRKRRAFREDDGDTVDPDRVNLGAPFWEGTVRQSRRTSPVVRVMFDISAPCNRPSKTLLWRGVTALVLADILEDGGYRVELVSSSYARTAFYTGESFFSTVIVKDPGSPMDVDSLAKACAGWHYRTVGFGVYHGHGPKPEPGYGFPSGIPESAEADVKIQKIWDAASARELLFETLERFV